jgi:ribosomal protein L7/L12
MLQQQLVVEVVMAAAPGAAEEVEEKTEFDLILMKFLQIRKLQY